LYGFGKGRRHLGKLGALRRGDPLKANALRLDAQQAYQFFSGFKDFTHLDITIQVMTVADVSAGDQDAVGAILESLEDKIGVDPPGTHDADDAQVRRILESAHPGEVGRGIGAPVTGKRENFWCEVP